MNITHLILLIIYILYYIIINNIQLQVSSIQSSTVVSSTYNIPEITVSNNSSVTIPQTIIGDVLNFVNSNQFNSTSNYINGLSSNNVITNPPSNDESSTLKAFFMSEMERLSTVKSVTIMDLG